MFVLSTDHQVRFAEEGFVIVPDLLTHEEVARAAERFEPLFRGEFETGLYPDEWNWREGRDAADLTRQICNGWKSDRTIASVVLREEIGRACAALMGWGGTRICQDNVLWKPPGAKSLGYHQDNSYQDWTIPAEMITCWIALDDTRVDGGALEHVRGSHRWELAPPAVKFHAPAVYDAEMRAAAARAGVTPDIVPIVVEAGTAVFHHGGCGTVRPRTARINTVELWSRIASRLSRASIRTTSVTSTAVTSASMTIQWTKVSFPSYGRVTEGAPNSCKLIWHNHELTRRFHRAPTHHGGNPLHGVHRSLSRDRGGLRHPALRR